MSAKFSLQRLLRGPNAAAAGEAIAAINTGALAGIFGDDLRAAVEVARRHGTQRWLLVPRGEDAALVLEPSDLVHAPPTIIFRDAARNDRARLDRALVRAIRSFALWRAGRLACQLAAPVQAEVGSAATVLGNIVPFCQLRTQPKCQTDRTRDGIELTVCQPLLERSQQPGQRVTRPGKAPPDTKLFFDTGETGSGVNPKTGTVGPVPLPTFKFTADVSFDAVNAGRLGRWEVGWIQNGRASRWTATYGGGARRCRPLPRSCRDQVDSRRVQPPWQMFTRGGEGPQALVPADGSSSGTVTAVLTDRPNQLWPLFVDGHELKSVHAGSVLVSWLVALRRFAPLDQPLTTGQDIVFLWSCRVTLDITWTLTHTPGAQVDAVFVPTGRVLVKDGPGSVRAFGPPVLCKPTADCSETCATLGQAIVRC
ncbi:MAG TPA: hypothetical protein VF101_04535 [Gaiellaceae bacterium]